MLKKLTCIECPMGCSLSVDIENCKVVKVTGNKCPKGLTYAEMEIENPMRILTSSVLTQGLDLKMVPVRTDRPIPKSRLIDVMGEIKKIKLDKPVEVGNIIKENFMGLGVDIVTTRRAKRG